MDNSGEGLHYHNVPTEAWKRSAINDTGGHPSI